MITINSARTMNLSDQYGIEVGKPADLIILDADNEMDAIRLMSECLYVIRRGKIVSQTQPAIHRLKFKDQTQRINFKR
jgi:cytosine deaminase